MTGHRGGAKRRRFLTALGATSIVGIAGCTDSLGSDDEDSESDETGADGDGDDDGETATERGPEYTVEFSATDIDLTDLGIEEAGELDAVTDDHYAELEFVLEVDGEEVEPDAVALEIDGEQSEYTGRLAESRLPEKTTDLTLYVEVDGEELEESASVEKHLPETYVREILVDGEIEQWEAWVARVTENANPDLYNSPYEFDTQNFTFEQFYQDRRRGVEEDMNPHPSVEEAHTVDFTGLNKQEKIAKASEYTNNEISGASAAAQDKAHAMELILRRYTDLEEPIIAGGFDNPGADDTSTGNHGSQMIHVDGDNYHSETYLYPGQEAVHVENIEDISMKSDANIGDYVSVVGELDPDFKQVSAQNGMRRLNTMISQITYPATLKGDERSYVDHPTGFKMRDLITENKFEEALLGEMIAVQHGKETGRHNALASTGDTVYAVSVKNEKEERKNTAREIRRRVGEKRLEGRELMDELSEWEEVF